MKNTAKQNQLTRCLLGSALIISLGACEVAHGPKSSPAVAHTSTSATAKLNQENARALVEAYAKKIDFSRFESGSARMAHRSDGSIFWRVSYKKILKKNDVVLLGADMLLFTVDDDTREVKSVLTY